MIFFTRLKLKNPQPVHFVKVLMRLLSIYLQTATVLKRNLGIMRGVVAKEI